MLKSSNTIIVPQESYRMETGLAMRWPPEHGPAPVEGGPASPTGNRCLLPKFAGNAGKGKLSREHPDTGWILLTGPPKVGGHARQVLDKGQQGDVVIRAYQTLPLRRSGEAGRKPCPPRRHWY